MSRQVAAYDEADGEILTALATQASIAIRNARLIEELARSRAVIERRAEAEQALREIATRITAIREPGDLLQRIVDEAFRLLRADGAVIDEYDEGAGVIIPAYDAGLTDEQRESVKTTRLRIGEGLSGRAMAERRVIAAGDYLAGEFTHLDSADHLARTTGIGDLIVAPIIGDEGPLGAIEVYRRERHAFDEMDAAVLGALADQAAIAITNAHLIRRARAVAGSRRQARRHRASAARDHRRHRRPARARGHPRARRRGGPAPAGHGRRAPDPDERRRHLPRPGRRRRGGRRRDRGLAARDALPARRRHQRSGRPARHARSGRATTRPIPRIPHEGNDDDVATSLGLCGMAAAPLRAPGGEVIGTLAISSRTPRNFDDEELDLLQGLADQAAIAITNSTLLTRLRDSEIRYRTLASSSPDLVFATDADGHWTFLSDRAKTMLGWDIEDTVGRHFSEVVADGWVERSFEQFAEFVANPGSFYTARLDFKGGDGRPPVPLEINVIGHLEDGRLSAIHGVARDISERERLEHDLQASEARFRNLVQTSPDVIYRCDADGRFLFMAEGSEALFGWTPAEVANLTFADLTAEESLAGGAGQLRGAAPRARSRPALPLHAALSRRDDLPGRDHVGLGLGGRHVRRRPGDGPRHHPAGTPRTRAARVAGALPLPRRERPGRRLLDRCRGQLHVHVGGDGAGLGLEARRGHRRPLLARRRRARACAHRVAPAGRRWSTIRPPSRCRSSSSAARTGS